MFTKPTGGKSDSAATNSRHSGGEGGRQKPSSSYKVAPASAGSTQGKWEPKKEKNPASALGDVWGDLGLWVQNSFFSPGLGTNKPNGEDPALEPQKQAYAWRESQGSPPQS